MKYINAIILALGLCADVLLASISQGLAIRKLTGKKLCAITLLFAVVQGGCAFAAYHMSEKLAWIFEWLDHWVSFGMLAIIGAVMLIRSYRDEEVDQKETKTRYLIVLLISIAISLDILAITTTDTFTHVNPWIGIAIIVVETLISSAAGLFAGHKLGVKYRYKSEFSGGILLLILAIKLLLFGVFRK